MIVFTVVIGLLQVVNAAERESLFVIRSLLILLGLGIAVIVLFAPKLYMMKINYKGNTVYGFFSNQKVATRKLQVDLFYY